VKKDPAIIVHYFLIKNKETVRLMTVFIECL
jgi:hypothetical protein